MDKKQQQRKIESEGKPGLGSRVRKYFEELKYEWQKLTFPTKKELTQSTIVVFLFTLILMTIIASYDWVMSLIFNNLILPVGR